METMKDRRTPVAMTVLHMSSQIASEKQLETKHYNLFSFSLSPSLSIYCIYNSSVHTFT